MERSKKLSQKLLRDRDPGSGGARNPHVLPCTLRFLCSVLTRLTAARDVFETASKAILIMVLAVAGLGAGFLAEKAMVRIGGAQHADDFVLCHPIHFAHVILEALGLDRQAF